MIELGLIVSVMLGKQARRSLCGYYRRGHRVVAGDCHIPKGGSRGPAADFVQPRASFGGGEQWVDRAGGVRDRLVAPASAGARRVARRRRAANAVVFDTVSG